MRSIVDVLVKPLVALVLVSCLAIPLGSGGVGCAARPQAREGALRVTAFSNREQTELSPDDVVRVLRRVGLVDEEILEVGPEMRNALASSGGARLQKGVTVEAMLAVDADRLHVSSRRTGSFIYPLQKSPPVRIAPIPGDRPAPDDLPIKIE